jgi:hypothetical protein
LSFQNDGGVQYLCHVYVKLVGFFLLDFFVDLVLNPNLAPQKVPPPMQYEHGDAMEENEWVHETSRGCYKVNACTSSYVAKWLLHKHLDQTHVLQMQLSRYECPPIHPKGFKQ